MLETGSSAIFLPPVSPSIHTFTHPRHTGKLAGYDNADYGGEGRFPLRRRVVNPVRSGRKQPQQPIRVRGSGRPEPPPV